MKAIGLTEEIFSLTVTSVHMHATKVLLKKSRSFEGQGLSYMVSRSNEKKSIFCPLSICKCFVVCVLCGWYVFD